MCFDVMTTHPNGYLRFPITKVSGAFFSVKEAKIKDLTKLAPENAVTSGVSLYESLMSPDTGSEVTFGEYSESHSEMTDCITDICLSAAQVTNRRSLSICNNNSKLNSVALIRERIIPTDRVIAARRRS
jgi:hypothetical protein